jgi:hypothetical protein
VGAGRESLTPLRQAVEEAYCLFKADPPDHWSGDDIGLGRRDWDRLTNVPLRELNRSDTNHFLSEAGDFKRHEVRYMLPRILDLFADGEDPHAAGLECCLGCLERTGYPDYWRPEERRVIEAFLLALIDQTLTEESYTEEASLDGVLCMAANANADLAPILAYLDQADETALARAVAFDFDLIGGLGEDGNLVNAFWESAGSGNRAAMIAWYRRADLAALLERAFFAESDPEWQRKLSAAVDVMRSWVPGPRDTPPA